MCQSLMRVIVLVVLCSGLSQQAYAEPTIVATSTRLEGDMVRVFYSVSGWRISDKGGTVCGRLLKTCTVTEEYVFYNSNVTNATWTISTDTVDEMTTGMLLRELNKKGILLMPYKGSGMVYKGYNFVGACIRLVALAGSNSSILSNCSPIPPIAAQCDISGSTIIDHKTLASNALNGATASIQLDLKCNDSTNVIVKATRTNTNGVRLRADGSLYSEVKVNGKDATGGIVVSTTNNISSRLNITSTLKAIGAVAPGAFSGSTVVTVSPP